MVEGVLTERTLIEALVSLINALISLIPLIPLAIALTWLVEALIALISLIEALIALVEGDVDFLWRRVLILSSGVVERLGDVRGWRRRKV